MKCTNPFCMNESKNKYCSEKCRTVVDELRDGNMKLEDDFEEYQKGSIVLLNSLEIRNDAMGKEIAGNRGFKLI